MSTERELSDFLRSVEKRAFKRTVFAVRDDDAALDIVQEAMIKLAEHYAARPASEWPMLFQRILSNATMDWFRRRKVRTALVQNLGDMEGADADDDGTGLLDALQGLDASLGAENPADSVSRGQTLQAIEDEVAALPARQREAFMLRYWEEFDVAETAELMGCSVGSVKTHCFRAVQSLAQALRRRGLAP